jgi:hypothetical protein
LCHCADEFVAPVVLLHYLQFLQKSCFLRGSNGIEKENFASGQQFRLTPYKAAERFDADPAGQQNRRARRIPRQRRPTEWALEKKFGADRQRLEGSFERSGSQAHGYHQISFVRRAGDGKSRSVALQIRVARAEQSKIAELPASNSNSSGFSK